MNDYVSATGARQFCTVSPTSLRLWSNQGQIRTIRTPGGKRFYHREDLCKLLGITVPVSTKIHTGIIYARVKSIEDQADLERQLEILQSQYSQYTVITDIGSGIKYNRKGLQKLLQQVSTGTITEIVVTSVERLCSYGIELIECIFQAYNTRLVVLGEESGTEREEFYADFYEMCQQFMSQRRRRGKYKKSENKENPIVSTQGSQTEDESSLPGSETDIQQMCEPIFIIKG